MRPIWKILVFFHSAGNPLQCDQSEKIIVFFHWAGNPLQCDYCWKILVFFTGQVTHYSITNLKNPCIFQTSARSPGTIRPLAKPFSRFFFLSGRLPGTIRPLAKPFSCFILNRVGRLEQLDHSRNSSRSFLIGQVAQTIWSI